MAASGTHSSDPRSREVEWQLDAVDLRPVLRWLSSRAADAAPSVGPGPISEHVDTYWDTEDWRLYRAGWSLRTRAGKDHEATMKSREDADGARRDRRELTEALADDGPPALLKAPGPVGERVR